MNEIQKKIRDYLDADDRAFTMRCFLGMIEGGEATLADFAAVNGATAKELRRMIKPQATEATKVADAIRNVTAKMTEVIDTGKRSTRIDANDIIDVLLAIADEIDPPISGLVASEDACPECGEHDPDNLVWGGDVLVGDIVRCSTCGSEYVPPARKRTRVTVERVQNTLVVMDEDGTVHETYEIGSNPGDRRAAKQKIREWAKSYTFDWAKAMNLV